MKGGARTGLQNRVAPDFRILAQDFSYLYLNNYTYYLYLKENPKKFKVEKMPPPLTTNWEIKKFGYFYSEDKQEYIMYMGVNTSVCYRQKSRCK